MNGNPGIVATLGDPCLRAVRRIGDDVEWGINSCLRGDDVEWGIDSPLRAVRGIGRSEVSDDFMGGTGWLENAIIDDLQQVLAIAAFYQGFGKHNQLFTGNQPEAPGNFFGAGNLQPLPFFQGLDKT
jgi:hypothetical protein